MRLMNGVVGHRAFRRRPLTVLGRLASAVTATALGRALAFSYEFGGHVVSFSFPPLGRKTGSFGIYVYREDYEPLLRYGHRLIAPGMCVIDGGANQGIFTCAFAKQTGPEGAVHSFEPLPQPFARLRENVDRNGVGNVVLNRAALYDADGEMPIDASTGDVSASLVWDFGSSDKAMVPVVGIDAYASRKRIPRVDFIKLDIEGAEAGAIAGARGIIARDRPMICVECLDAFLFGEICERLPDYRKFMFDELGELREVHGFERAHNLFFIHADHTDAVRPAVVPG